MDDLEADFKAFKQQAMQPWSIYAPITGTVGGGYSDRRPHGAHHAVDWQAPAGTPVVAPGNMRFITGRQGGTNLRKNDWWSYWEDMDTGLQYRFAHHGPLTGIKPGDIVQRGQQWNVVGNAISGPHIHMGIWNQQRNQPIDYGQMAGLHRGQQVGLGEPIDLSNHMANRISKVAAVVPQNNYLDQDFANFKKASAPPKDDLEQDFANFKNTTEKSDVEERLGNMGVPKSLIKAGKLAGRGATWAAQLPVIKQGLQLLTLPAGVIGLGAEAATKQMEKIPALAKPAEGLPGYYGEGELPSETVYGEKPSSRAQVIGKVGEQLAIGAAYGILGKGLKFLPKSAMAQDIRRIFAPETAGPKAMRSAELWVEHSSRAHADYARAEKLADTYRTAMGKLSPEDRWHISSLMEKGEPVPEMWQPYAQIRKEMFEKTWTGITDTGKELGYIENYAPHLFKNPEQASTVLPRISRRPFEGRKGYFKQRTRVTDMETLKQQYGLEPLFPNPVDQDLAQYLEQLKFIQAHGFKDSLRKEGLIKFFPSGKQVPGGEDWVRLSDPTRASAKLFEVWTSTPTIKGAKIVEPNKIKLQWSPPSKAGEYFAPREVADLIDNHFSPGRQSLWITKYQNAAAAWNAWHVAWSGFHGTATTVHDIANGFAQGVPETLGKLFSGDIKGAAKAFARMEPLTHSWRTYRIGKKAIETGLAPGTHPELDYIVAYGLKGGMRLGDIHPLAKATAHSLTEFFGDIFRSPKQGIPQAFRTIIRQASKPLMDYYVPRIKWGTFVRRFQRESEKIMAEYAGQPARGAQKAEMMKRLQTAAYQERQFVENIYGQLAYDNLHMSQGLMRGLKAMIGYPGWNVGTFRWLAGTARAPLQVKAGMDKQTRRSAEFTMGLLASNAIFNSLMQYGMIGEWPKDWKDVMIGARTGRILNNGAPERLGVASYMKDMLGMAYHPGSTIANKEMFAFRIGSELYHNKDWQNVEIRSTDKPLPWQTVQLGKHLGKEAAMPFGPGSMIQAPSTARAVGAFMGVTPRSRMYSNTPAQQMMDEYFQKTTPAMRTEEQAEKSKLRRETLQKGREGQVDVKEEAKKAVKEGKMTSQQATNLMKAARTAPLATTYRNVKDLGVAINVFKAGTEEEKQTLANELAIKIVQAHPETQRKFINEIKAILPEIKKYRQPWRQ